MANTDLIVGSKIREFIKSNECMTSSEFLPELNDKVKALIKDACKRAKGNKRTTLKSQDL